MGLDIDLNQPAILVQDIDLNKPASPDIESNTQTITSKKGRQRRPKMPISEIDKRYVERLKSKPEKYKRYLNTKSKGKKKWIENLTEEGKKRQKEMSNKRSQRWKERKRVFDPTYVVPDARKGIRKRVRDGTATEEDKEKYKALSEYSKARYQKKKQAKEAQ